MLIFNEYESAQSSISIILSYLFDVYRDNIFRYSYSCSVTLGTFQLNLTHPCIKGNKIANKMTNKINKLENTNFMLICLKADFVFQDGKWSWEDNCEFIREVH